MLKLAKKFWNDENGLELSEYAVLLALIIAALVGTVALLREAIKGRFSDTATTITNAETATAG